MRLPAGGWQRQRGVTLIELVIVVLFMSILTRVATPKYIEALTNYRLDTATRRVVSDLRMARAYAQKVSVPQTVDFDAATEGYTVPGVADVDHPGDAYAVDLDSGHYAAQIVSTTFGAGDTIQFDIYGRPNRTGTVVIQVGSKQKTVAVDDAGVVSIP